MSAEHSDELSAAARSEIAKILGRLGGLKGGRSRSPAKVAAARRNAKRAGRPRRTEVRSRSRH
jgi:hypothetical protein